MKTETHDESASSWCISAAVVIRPALPRSFFTNTLGLLRMTCTAINIASGQQQHNARKQPAHDRLTHLHAGGRVTLSSQPCCCWSSETVTERKLLFLSKQEWGWRGYKARKYGKNISYYDFYSDLFHDSYGLRRTKCGPTHFQDVSFKYKRLNMKTSPRRLDRKSRPKLVSEQPVSSVGQRRTKYLQLHT